MPTDSPDNSADNKKRHTNRIERNIHLFFNDVVLLDNFFVGKVQVAHVYFLESVDLMGLF